jgi:hypothetical protein
VFGVPAALDGGTSDDGTTAVLVVSAATIAVFGGAAVYGFGKARSCREVRDEYRTRYQQQQEMLRQPQIPAGGPFGPPSVAPRAPQ